MTKAPNSLDYRNKRQPAGDDQKQFHSSGVFIQVRLPTFVWQLLIHLLNHYEK